MTGCKQEISKRGLPNFYYVCLMTTRLWLVSFSRKAFRLRTSLTLGVICMGDVHVVKEPPPPSPPVNATLRCCILFVSLSVGIFAWWKQGPGSQRHRSDRGRRFQGFGLSRSLVSERVGIRSFPPRCMCLAVLAPCSSCNYDTSLPKMHDQPLWT